MHRLLATTSLVLVALAALASSALGATPRPTVTSFSPAQVPVGKVLTLKGKNFRSGIHNNRVFFSRASDGKTVRATPKTASKTKITVVVPATITRFLDLDSTGAPKATRFEISIFTTKLGPKTKRSKSPLILPAGSSPVPTTPGTGGGTGTPTPTAADCDGDGTPNSIDNDDDNDLIPDDVEAKIGTDPCNKDTDGDGIEDGFEYYSALDMNGNNLPYPGKRPFPNPLDGSDANKDFDLDGLTDQEEFAAWMTFGNHALPLNYSAGNANTGGTNDGTDDADGDGLNNITELAKAPTALFNPSRDKLNDTYPFLYQLNWLDADSDGDTIPDGADDQDHDGLSNIEEITNGDDGRITDPENPNSGSPDCDADGVPNAQDSDDDNDGLPDTVEQSIGTSQCNKDTDGDGVEDGYEYWSARDLNGNNLPYPGNTPYPNPLYGKDADTDFDGDGMTQKQEFGAWNLYGGRSLPTGTGQTFPYSDGNQQSSAPSGVGYMDLNEDGIHTDEEKDADGDGIPNWIEIAATEPTPVAGCAFSGPVNAPSIYTDCGTGSMPNANTFRIPSKTVTGAPSPAYLAQTNYLVPDTDGDGVTDGADDQDLDGVSNLQEITVTFTDPQDPCDPNPNARTCPTHPSH